MELKVHKKQHDKFESYFLKEFKFLDLELYGKLKFYKVECQKGNKLLNIL